MIRLAVSKAGHDKNHTYVVIGENEDAYLLADGNTKTIKRPKTKKKMHVQLIKKVPEDVLLILEDKSLTDEVIARGLAIYNKR